MRFLGAFCVILGAFCAHFRRIMCALHYDLWVSKILIDEHTLCTSYELSVRILCVHERFLCAFCAHFGRIMCALHYDMG